MGRTFLDLELMMKNFSRSTDTLVRSLFESWFQQKKELHQLYQFSNEELKQKGIQYKTFDELLSLLKSELQLSSF